ncbi:unnamed protein product [Mytilus edulis]|uniref:Uncharacterized protein n=1 Tax=Mytilus edulis TaxID=6550 RepID=A0A8S3U1B0_MYTED|nr:unnamed protein product [Mytilus edulis]
MENVENTNLWIVELHWLHDENVKLDIRVYYLEPGMIWGTNLKQLQCEVNHTTWTPYVFLSSADRKYYSSALLDMCRYIIQTVVLTDSKEAILQLEALTKYGQARFPISVCFKQANLTTTMLRTNLISLQNEINLCQDNIMAFCYFLYHINSNHDILSDKTVINPEVAQLALQCLKSIPENSIPSTCTKDIAHVIQQFCKLHFSEEASLIFVVDLCFYPLGEEACLSFRLSVKREKTREIFEKIVRLLPWKEHCTFLTDTASEWDWKDNGFLRRMEYSFVTKVVTALAKEGARGYLLNVFEIWETVNTVTHITMDRIYIALEEALTNTLSAYDDQRKLCHKEKLLSVINDEKLFKKHAAKVELLNF